MRTITELERNKAIYAEYQRINKYFENLDENQKSLIDPLIRNAAFMRVALDDLQEIIAEQGPVEQYRNSETQYGTKQSAALQSYNALVKNYAAVIKNLFSLLPRMERLVTMIPEPKTLEEIEEERHRDELRAARTNAEIRRASDWQHWVWEQEQSGIKPNMSLQQWENDHPITDKDLENILQGDV